MKVIVFCLTLIGMGLAAVTHAADPDPDEAQRVVEETTTLMRDTLRANRETLAAAPEKIAALVHEIVVPKIDDETIAKLVLGPHWRSASADQRSRFTAEFRDLLINTYAKALLEYIDTDIEFLGVVPSNRANRVTVRTSLKPAQGKAIPIDYTMCHDGQVWKVCNMTIDRSINFVVNYRKQVGDQVGREGLDRVIESISERNAQH